MENKLCAKKYIPIAFSFILLCLLSFSFGKGHKINTNCSCVIKESSLKKKDFDSGEEFYKNLFSSCDSSKKRLLRFVYRHYMVDCNSEQLAIGEYEYKEADSVLSVYTFYCHQGDPTGKEYGARVQTYKWNCRLQRLTPLDSMIHLDESGCAGCYEEDAWSDDPETRKERKKHVRWLEKDRHARYIPGKKGKQMVKEVRTKMWPRILKETKKWETLESGFGYKR